MHTVVLDTTELFKSLQLNGPNWTRLFAYSTQGLIDVVVPETVVRETVRHQQRKARAAAKDAIDHFAEARGALGSLGIQLTESVGALRKAVKNSSDGYERQLRETLVNGRVNVPALPSISHETLLAWVIANRKPFAESGEGYKDALIWATILELAQTKTASDELWFVTDNIRDFHGKPGVLAGDLQSDLDVLDNAPKLKIFRSLEDLLASKSSEFARLDDEQLEALLASTPTATELVRGAVLSAAENLSGREISEGQLDSVLPSYFENPSIWTVEPQEWSLVWSVADEYEGGTLVGTATVDASIVLDGYMAKASYYAAEDEVGLLEFDFNDHYAWVSFDTEVQLTFTATVNPQAESVDNIEYQGLEPTSI